MCLPTYTEPVTVMISCDMSIEHLSSILFGKNSDNLCGHLRGIKILLLIYHSIKPFWSAEG